MPKDVVIAFRTTRLCVLSLQYDVTISGRVLSAIVAVGGHMGCRAQYRLWAVLMQLAPWCCWVSVRQNIMLFACVPLERMFVGEVDGQQVLCC